MDRRRLAVGQQFTKVLVEDLKRTQLVQYAGASGDFNPLHTDDVHARGLAGLPGVFAHGMLTMAMAGSLVSDVVGSRNVTHFGGRFKAQVWPGDSLTVHMEIVGVTDAPPDAYRADFVVHTMNQDAVEVFSATAIAVLPQESDA